MRCMNFLKQNLAILLTAVLAVSSFAHLPANEDNTAHRTGLIALSEAELQHIDQHWPHVVGVRMNKIGAHRINEHISEDFGPEDFRVSNITIPDIAPENEFVSVVGSPAFRSSLGLEPLALESLDPSVLPRSVDNSQLPSFPPIGNQGSLGSCGAWSSTYYQASHEVGLMNGVNNKTSKAGILSPKWTYNLLNMGQDAGIDLVRPFQMLSEQGAPSILALPVDNDYLSWDLNTQDWIDALNNRLTPAQVLQVGSSDQQLQVIKQTLNNGHVLVVGTWAYSWQMAKVGVDPAAASNPHAGEEACSWVKGRSGGHAVTIVGYDDDIWIDINGDGKVDAAEKGAFLVANQWGTTWANNGFFWVSYDAFRPKSALANGPSDNRVGFADILNNAVVLTTAKALNYKPTLIAQYSITQSLRNQITILTAVSATTDPGPTNTKAVTALNRQGGAYEFDGNKPERVTSATFVTDLTDLIASAVPGQAQRFYLLVSDGAIGSATTLTKFSLLDVVRGTQLDCPDVPATVDNQITVKHIDYDLKQPVPGNLPSVSITSPLDGSSVKGNVQVTVQAKSDLGIARVDLFVNGNQVGSVKNGPYLFSVDTAQLTGSTATFKAVAVDTKGQQSSASITVTLSQTGGAGLYYINSGGGTVNNGGITWLADNYFAGQSSTASTMFPFANPVYQTQRLGKFTYTFPVDNGKYRVTLQFADLFGQLAGDRTFNVSINNSVVISNLNLYQVAGFAKMYDRAFDVQVIDNKITVQFNPVNANGQAVINGISIVPVK